MVCAITATLAACGGGGSDSSTTTTTATATTPTTATAAVVTAEGLYVGSTSTGRTTTGIVLDDGTYYVIYSAQNNPSLIAGAVVGTGTSSNGSFSSTSARDINLEGLGLLSGSLSASYTQQKSLNGSINYPSLNQTVTFTGAYDSAFQTTPTLAAVAGTYTGRVGHPRGNEAASVTVSSMGAISGRGASGCVVSGSLTPRAKGNVYTTSVTFGGSPCLLPNATLTGASYFDAATKRLYAVGMTSARDNGMIFAGAKP